MTWRMRLGRIKCELTSHLNVTNMGVTTCVRCGKRWVRDDD
jgi:hypothetical protein